MLPGFFKLPFLRLYGYSNLMYRCPHLWKAHLKSCFVKLVCCHTSRGSISTIPSWLCLDSKHFFGGLKNLLRGSSEHFITKCTYLTLAKHYSMPPISLHFQYFNACEMASSHFLILMTSNLHVWFCCPLKKTTNIFLFVLCGSHKASRDLFLVLWPAGMFIWHK